MAGLSNAQQDRLIRASWPGFRTVIVGERLAIWRGKIQGLSHAYEVEITYARNRHGDAFRYDYAPFPEVTVLEPLLCARVDDPLDPIPHVYNFAGQDRPVLCLFDPRSGGWTRNQAIADTILVWTASWLRFYEAWHATGVWTGGSAPHGPRTLPASARDEEDGVPRFEAPACRRPALLAGVCAEALLAGHPNIGSPPGASKRSALTVAPLAHAA